MTQPRNPFTRSGALRLNHPLFRGRTAELAQLEQACLAEYDFFLLVYGGRQNGKTSLLLRLEERLRTHLAAGVRVCRVDFQGLPRATSSDAYRHLAQRVAQSLPHAPNAPDAPDAPALGDFLEQTLASGEVTRLVLLLDELGTLPDPTREDLAHVLRALHTRQRDSPALTKAQFVLAGGIEIYNLAVVEASALRNVCEVVRLGDLREADAVALIADGLATTGVATTEARMLGQTVYACVRGHPYLTQRLGELLAAHQLSGTAPTVAEVETLAWALLEQDDPLLEHLRRSVADLGLEAAARRLLRANQRTTRGDDALARLELIGLAWRGTPAWAPRSPLLAVALAEWLGFGLPRGLTLLTAAAQARQIARVQHLSDLKLELATTSQRVPTATTVKEQVDLQRRATNLADEIRQIEAAQATLPAWVPELVKVPAGPFLMGSTDEQIAAVVSQGANADWVKREKSQHRLTLPDYWIGKTPITNAQFRPFVDGDGYTNQAYWTVAGWQWREGEKLIKPLYWDDAKWNGAAYPVVGVSWFEAVAYCRWLSKQTGIAFRLPSEAEWEKAARGSDGLIYPWGNTWDASLVNSSESGLQKTTPVGSYPKGASPYGALDMAGNVWEWCATQWLKPYPYQLEDEWPTAYVEANADYRMLRGGSWYNNSTYVRGAHRFYFLPRDRHFGGGLRVASHSLRIDSGF